jgi:hypothetical protein
MSSSPISSPSPPPPVALRRFLSAYFHPEWREESATPDEVVARYAAAATAEELAQVANELELLLPALPPDDRLRSYFVTQLGCYYFPREGPQAARQWLAKLREQLER